MNAEDGHAMLVARCMALEEIALQYMLLYTLETATYFPTDKEHKESLEKQVERIAPGCSHLVK